MKKASIGFVSLLVFSTLFIAWANINGLIILIIDSPRGNISGGELYTPSETKDLMKLAGRLVGAYTAHADSDISLSVTIDGVRRKISFGYVTPGEFQINEIHVDRSGAFNVEHHAIP